MESNLDHKRQQAHTLLDMLPTEKLNAVRNLLEVMIVPDENGDTLSSAERQAVAEADEWLRHNRPIAHEQVLAEFGLTMADWVKMCREPMADEMHHRNSLSTTRG